MATTVIAVAVFWVLTLLVDMALLSVNVYFDVQSGTVLGSSVVSGTGQEMGKVPESGTTTIPPSVGFGHMLVVWQKYGVSLKAPEPGFPTMGIWFYSTFLTSFWVWLYAVAAFLVKLGKRLGLGMKVLTKILNVENKPIRSIDFVSSAVITVVYGIIALAVTG